METPLVQKAMTAVKNMIPEGYEIFVIFGRLRLVREAASRPSPFRGDKLSALAPMLSSQLIFTHRKRARSFKASKSLMDLATMLLAPSFRIQSPLLLVSVTFSAP